MFLEEILLIWAAVEVGPHQTAMAVACRGRCFLLGSMGDSEFSISLIVLLIGRLHLVLGGDRGLRHSGVV